MYEYIFIYLFIFTNKFKHVISRLRFRGLLLGTAGQPNTFVYCLYLQVAVPQDKLLQYVTTTGMIMKVDTLPADVFISTIIMMINGIQ